eukprot:SAG31_NODE_1769_length_7312_cov_9.295577_4_plen_71_part_00
MPEARAQWMFQQILSAMHYCHSSGVCHRDLKLENLMVDVVDGSELIKITDFIALQCIIILIFSIMTLRTY